MYRVKLFNKPETARVLEGKNCIHLFAPNEIIVQQKELCIISWTDFTYEFENAVGIPYHTKQDMKLNLTLYYPKGSFKWTNVGVAKIALINNSTSDITIHPGDFVASIKLMSIQFYELWKRNNNSDKGLLSVPVKIELYENTIKNN